MKTILLILMIAVFSFAGKTLETDSSFVYLFVHIGDKADGSYRNNEPLAYIEPYKWNPEISDYTRSMFDPYKVHVNRLPSIIKAMQINSENRDSGVKGRILLKRSIVSMYRNDGRTDGNPNDIVEVIDTALFERRKLLTEPIVKETIVFKPRTRKLTKDKIR